MYPWVISGNDPILGHIAPRSRSQQGHEIEKSLSLSIGQILIAYNSTIDKDILTKLDGHKDMHTLSDTHEFHSDWSNQSTVTAFQFSHFVLSFNMGIHEMKHISITVKR